MSHAQRYKVQQRRNGRGGQWVAYHLTLPPEFAEAVPENAQFEVELVDEGILYRFVGVAEPGEVLMEEVPSWVEQP